MTRFKLDRIAWLGLFFALLLATQVQAYGKKTAIVDEL
jgi:hypothetical protein